MGKPGKQSIEQYGPRLPSRPPSPGKLAALRGSLIAAGWSATSPLVLDDPEDRRLAGEEKWT